MALPRGARCMVEQPQTQGALERRAACSLQFKSRRIEATLLLHARALNELPAWCAESIRPAAASDMLPT